MKYTPTCILVGAALISTASAAESPAAAHSNPAYNGWEFGLTLGQTQLDSSAAASAYIGETADTLTLYGEYYFAQSPWMLNGGLGFLSYDDKLGYSQRVRDNYGDSYSKDSAANAASLFIEGGAHYPLGNTLFLQGRAGIAALVDSSRSIENCADCYEEDIDLSAGLYGLVKFGGTLRNTVEIAVQYQYYLSGDLSSSVALSISSHFY